MLRDFGIEALKHAGGLAALNYVINVPLNYLGRINYLGRNVVALSSPVAALAGGIYGSLIVTVDKILEFSQVTDKAIVKFAAEVVVLTGTALVAPSLLGRVGVHGVTRNALLAVAVFDMIVVYGNRVLHEAAHESTNR